MPPIEDQRRASVTYARTSAFSELDHQLIGHPSPNVWPLPTSRPANGHANVGLREIRVRPVPNRNRRQRSRVGPRPGASRGDRGVRFSLSMLRRSHSAPGSSPA